MDYNICYAGIFRVRIMIFAVIHHINDKECLK